MPSLTEREGQIYSRLVFLFGDQAAALLPELDESKHIGTHRDPGRWDSTIRKWSTSRQARRDRETLAAAAIAMSHAGGLSRRLMSLLALCERYLKESKAADERSRTLAGAAAVLAAQQSKTALQKFRSTLERARQELRAVYRRNLRAGMKSKGIDKRAVTGEDKRWVDTAAKKEAVFFTGVARDLAGGKPLASLAPRVTMYGKAAMGAFFAGQVLAAGPNEQIRWEVDPSIENCPDCLELEARGPYTRDTLPTQPGAGATRCVVDPSAPVWTASGRVPISEVRVGDLVWTHRGRLRLVTGVSSSLAGHARQSAFAGGVQFTADHGVFTWDGWQPLSAVALQQLRMIHPQHVEILLEMFGDDAFGPAHSAVPSLRECVSNLRFWEGSSSERVRLLRPQPQGEAAVADKTSDDIAWDSERSQEASCRVGGSNRPEFSSTDEGRAICGQVLGGRQDTTCVPLPLALEDSAWADPAGYGPAPQERRLHGRQAVEFGTVAGLQTSVAARFGRETDSSSVAWARGEQGTVGALSRVWNGISFGLASADGWLEASTGVLLGPMLKPGTRLYDLTVDGDESFVIGDGVIAQNCRSNCGCTLVFEPVSDEEAEHVAGSGVNKNYLLRRITGPRAGRR